MDGRRQGKGQYVCKQSGSKYEVKAKYSCDIKTFHGANDFHQGQYSNDKKEGQGKYSWSNGDWYEGEWKAGLRHGHGIYVWKDKNEKYDS